jgi:hypothetical protein
MSTLRLSLLIALVLVLAAGSQAQAPAKDTATVFGKVIFQGQPLTGGKIEFHYSDKGKPITADLQKDGTYAAKKVPLGELKVVFKVKGLPRKYTSRDTTPLIVEVKKGKQVADFELK